MENNNFIDIDKLRNNITLYIYTSPYVENITEYACNILNDYKIKNYRFTSIISDEHLNIINDNNNCFLFLFVYQSFLESVNKEKLLKLKKRKYILYQFEQINTEEKYSKFIKPEFNNFINNALYILDYNIINYNNLSNECNKLYVGVPIYKIDIDFPKKDIDILFYGNINNYRKDILDFLSKYFNIKIVEKAFGKELRDLIIRSKLVLNIHYYQDALLEICRIHEAIPYKCKIISDIVTDEQKNICKKYENFCTFTDFNNKENLVNVIKEELENYDNINFDNLLDKNIKIFNKEFTEFIKKIKFYNLFNKDLLNIKNSTYNYKLSLIDDEGNLKNIIQNYITNKNRIKDKNLNEDEKVNDLNIKFKNSKQNDIYLKMLKKINKDKKSNEKKISEKINNFSDKKIIDNIAHLHCYDLSKFDEMYGLYLNKIETYFKIIITYSIISSENSGYSKYNKNFILLNIENRGLDIGAKFTVIHYLLNNNIDYKFILFLHSKTSNLRRKKYFTFINERNIEDTLLKMGENYDGIFPNMQMNGDWNTGLWYINKSYTEDLLEYMDCDIKEKKFIEGNCMILSRRVIKKIFEDNLFMYTLLNNKDSFDNSWYSWYYKSTSTSFIDNYNSFITNKKYGNDLSHNYKKIFGDKVFIDISKLKNLDGFKLSDSMIEHAFERIYLNVINSFEDGKYYILN